MSREGSAQERAAPVKLLLIGPLPGKPASLGEPIGGARVTFAEAVRELPRRGFDLDLINTARPRPNLPRWKILSYELLTFARVVWSVLRRARRSDLVFFHLSAYSALTAATTIWALCRLLRRPLALRFFGDSLYFTYHRYGPARRWLMDRTFLRAPLVYEERQTRREFSRRDNFRWLANTRDLSPAETGPERDPDRGKVRKLLFMGQLRMEKGLAEALDAGRSLPEDCQLRVFGPRMPNTDFSLFEGHPRATYGGVLEPAEAPRVLAEHDLLLFLSYLSSEGTPGVIIEAFQCGVPVIATAIGGVPEQVEHEKSGLLVAPRSVPELQAALARLLDDPALYRRLSAGARQRGEFYRPGGHFDRLAEELRELTGK